MYKKITILATVLFCSLTFSSLIFALPGDLDATFDSDGIAVTDLLGNEYGVDVLVQNDNKILVGGFTLNQSAYDTFIARYNPDGSFDNSFGTDGKIALVEAGNQIPQSFLLRPDGKILAIGLEQMSISAPYSLLVYRFNQDGSLDATFGTGGKVVHSLFNGSLGSDAVIQPDGKIVIAGQIITGDPATFAVFRLNTDGSLDTSFNSTGYHRITSTGSIRTEASTVALQSDGKIIVGGKVADSNYNSGLWGRFNTDGTLDGPNLIPSNVYIEDSAVQTDGKVVFVGGISFGFAITRFNADQTLDKKFGNSGINTASNTGRQLSTATSVLIQPNGRIVVGASVVNDIAVSRFNTNGFLDVGFGSNGITVTSLGTVQENVNSLAQQADGKLLAAGLFRADNNYNSFVIRYDGGNSNTLPNRTPFDFDGDGRADISVFRPSNSIWYRINSLNNSFNIRPYGISGDIPVPADYDGDGRTDFAVYRGNGQWWLNVTVNLTSTFSWGQTGDIPRPSDFDGDGKADLIVYRPSNNTWLRRGTTGVTSNIVFGTAGDQPLIGDFDGDGKSDPAVFRPSNGDWWYASSINGQFVNVHWGATGDIPVPGDYDADGKTDFVVFRPSDGGWYILYSTGSYTIATFGTVGDKPVAADFDGDGKTDIAVFRPSTGVWYLLMTTAGFGAVQWGIAEDMPSEFAFIQ